MKIVLTQKQCEEIIVKKLNEDGVKLVEASWNYESDNWFSGETNKEVKP